MKIEDFNLSESKFYITTPKPITYAEAGKVVLDRLEKANISEFAKKEIMSKPYLWVDVLAPDGLEKLIKLNAKGDDFLLLRLLDD